MSRWRSSPCRTKDASIWNRCRFSNLSASIKLNRNYARCFGHCTVNNFAGRFDVLFSQQRRDRQRVGVVVKAVSRVIGRKLDGSVEFDTHQIANRIAVLQSIEPSQSAGARIGLLATGRKNVSGDPFEQQSLFRVRWLIFTVGWHDV